MNNDVKNLLNEQINKELFSAYLYMDMANYYTDKDLDGFANWFFIQTQEERDHAMLFRTYLLNNGQKVELTAIAAPGKEYESFKDPLVMADEHEKDVTASIHNIYEQAFKNKDFRTMQFLDWFVKEQGEEEKNTDELIKKYDLYAGDSKGLYLLNNELGARVYAPPSLVL